jgi:DNA-binding HxlR family transcriptional regulator
LDTLPGLFHHRWAVPTLAALEKLGGGAKLVTLQRKLGASRELLKGTLAALIEARVVSRNPGYGHPMRPEYLLTPAGRQLAPACARLVEKLRRLGIQDVGLRKWSLPVAHALATAGGRFNRLRAALGDVTPRALAQALRDLQRVGLVERRLVDDNPPRTEYQLTRAGQHLTPAVLALVKAK